MPRPPYEPEKRQLPLIVDNLLASYDRDARTHHLGATFLPSRTRAIEIIEHLRQILFPGFFDHQRLNRHNIRYHTGERVSQAYDLLYDQVRQALRYEENRRGAGQGDVCEDCDAEAERVVDSFLTRLPELRRMLELDIKAAFDGDPAAVSTDETVFCYPGVMAVCVYRMAHELWELKVPLLPRIMGEWAHAQTGIDIHPGAHIGESFFIDHGTGVVIGETTDIGNRVKIYQGVTLGALSTKGGQAWRGRKRHPTIEDDVTIYPNTTILGGETVIGRGCVINGSVFLTHSVPPFHTVRVKHPELELRERRNKSDAVRTGDDGDMDEADFQI